jgi:predicted house-cleaning noncanonical NTP pyrophosphatase (MazG superfamily)
MKDRDSRESYLEKQENKLKIKPTKETEEENCENLVRLLKLIQGCESVTNATQECMTQDEEQLTDNDIADFELCWRRAFRK